MFERNLDFYKDFGTIISSRGCPFTCIFCSQRLISGNRYRFLPGNRVINKIRLLVDKYHQSKIFFVDDTFTVNKKRTLGLLDDIIASGYNKKASFIIESRGREINWELLLKMKEANIVSIAYGVETGSERLMATIKKGERVEDNTRAIELTHKAGIAADASIIFGLPTESKEERRLTSKYVRNLPLDGARFNIAIPYPGTEFYEMAKREGRLNIKDDWINCSNQHYLSSDDIPYTPSGTGRSELVYDVFIANIRYTLRIRTLLKILFSPFMTGGTVFSIKKKWFASPKILFAIFKLIIFLAGRSMMILVKGGILSRFEVGK